MKKWIFRSIMVLIPFIILLLFEGILWITGYGTDYKLFIKHPDKEFSNYKICNPEAGKKYFQKNEPSSPPSDMFLKKKPENGFRIFVLGSSTVAGFPYEQNLLFSRILQERLQDCYPEKHIEVINTAITATNSYTFADFTDDILKENPDAILFYEGHNEFYGALGVASNERLSKRQKLVFLHFSLLNLRTYQLVRNTMATFSGMISTKGNSEDLKGTLMKRIVENKNIIYQDEVYKAGIEQFKRNMHVLFNKTNKKNVPVFISEVVSNIRDLKPFCSSTSGPYPPADTMFLRASDFEKSGDYDKAKRHYYLAKDLDCVRFRASEEINDLIQEMASKNYAFLVPMKSYFEKSSANGIMGDNLFTEHLHPNIDGYFLMADAFFNEIAKSKLIDSKIDIANYKKSAYYKANWGYTELDSTFAAIRVNTLKCLWPFQPVNAPLIDYRTQFIPQNIVDSFALQAVMKPDLGKGIIEAHEELAKYYSKNGDFYKAYKEYYSIIKCFPYYAQDYINAASCLIKTNDFPGALKLINKSLEYETTFSAYMMKSEILLLRKDYIEAIDIFNKASELQKTSEQKTQLLAGLYEAYTLSNQPEQAKKAYGELMQIAPGYKITLSSKDVDYNMLVPEQVSNLVFSAFEDFQKRKMDEAFKKSVASLEIKETALANRIAGEILIQKDSKDALVFFKKAFPEYKKDVSFLYNYCVLNIKYRNKPEAVKLLAMIKEINPGYQNIEKIERYLGN